MVDTELLRKYLHEGVVKVTFTKANGDKRVMNCSLHPDYLPLVDEPKIKVAVANPDAIRVMDVDISDWRSFRYDSVLEMVV